jgi:fatty acid desaturase
MAHLDDSSVSPELRSLLREAHKPSRLIYWADFLTSAILTWGLLLFSILANTHIALRLVAGLGAALALLRAAYFIHEISHAAKRGVPGFEWMWHILIGIPFMLPSLMIGAHKNHHKTSIYGTDQDPEFQPLAQWPYWRGLLDLFSVCLAPAALYLRWAISPLSWMIPSVRNVLIQRASTLAFNPAFIRDLPTKKESKAWIIQEMVMFAYVSTLAALLALNWVRWDFLLGASLIMISSLFINQIRTYVGHRFEGDGKPRNAQGQLEDTLTLEGGWLSELVAPLGDRYHALHHRYPNLPYHALPRVHRVLMQILGENSPYARTRTQGLIPALVYRWRAFGNATHLNAHGGRKTEDTKPV